MVDYLLRSAVRPDQPRPSIETLLHAFVPAPHVDHTHPDAVIALTSTPGGRSARRGGVRRRGGLARLPAARLRHVAADRASCSTSNPAARAVLLEKHGLVTWGETGEESYAATIEFVSRAARGDRRGGGRRLRAGRQKGRGARGATSAAALLAPALPALRGALLADAGRRRSSRSTEARRRSRSRRPRGRRGQPGRRAVPRPPDQHEAQAARRRRSTPTSDDAGALARRVRAGVDEYAALVPRLLRANLDDETRQFPIDPAGPRVVLVPGVGIVTRGRRRRPGARRARPLPPRDRRRGRRRRDRRLPLAERERGVRDRVLAARALQARAGAAARRARRPGRADHRRRERDRPRDRARCSPRAAPTSSSPT